MFRAIAIVGPTAVGKTELSLDLAEMLGGEIINADSMQLYRGMDIGTAKIPESQRRGIPHHLLDVLDVTQAANVSDYQRAAREVIATLTNQGKVPIMVGGSGLFVNAVLDDMQFPGSDADIRARLISESQQLGLPAMYQRLVDVDPQAAAQVLPTNERRVLRALEVYEVTGHAPKTSLPELPEVIPSLRIGLRRDRSELDVRIDQRVDQMWDQGFVAEVQVLEKRGLRNGLTASQALGYKQILSALAGECSMEQAKIDTASGTRRYVRRQEAWFKRDSKIHWLDATTVTAKDIAVTFNLLP